MVMPRYSHPHENKTHTCTQRAYGIKDDIKCGRKAFSICQPVSILHLNSNIRFCNKQAVEYIGWKLLDLPWPNSSACWQGRACSHPRPLNTLTDESERCYFLFSCISSWHSKCMVFHTKEKYLRIQHMVTDFPSYLILYYTLDFPGRDVYLIPFFCRAWISTLPLLPCGSIVVCFWLLPILPQRHGDKEPISGDSEWSRKPFFVNKLLFKEHFYIPYWPLAPGVLETFICFSHHLPPPTIVVIIHLMSHVLSSLHSCHLCSLWPDAAVCGQ